jgi:hypothetical protein
MARLVPCLVALRDEFNELYPGRDKSSDGWIGDTAHQASRSDHNPDSRGLVHAIDVDRDLGGGGSMLAYVNHLLGRCRSGAERRLTYIIYDGYIWSASYGWARRVYDGSNPHDKHAHFSADDVPSRENSTASWRLEEVPVALTPADKEWIRDVVRDEVAKVPSLDGDPSERRYSLGGLATMAEKRTDQLANTDLPQVKRKLDELGDLLAEIRAAVTEPIPPKPGN